MANEDKTLSPQGELAIKLWEEEGGKPKLKAYNDGTGTWTIGWGCTKGVRRGMVITAKQAQAMFDTEIAVHIGEVHRLIKREISQGLFDALVSFFFNNGSGRCPTLIKRVNEGEDSKIRAAFMMYVNAYDQRLGRKVPWPGLVARRQKELAHWAEMDAATVKIPTKRLPPAEPPPVAAVAMQSKSVWALVNAQALIAFGFLTDWGAQALDFVGNLFDVIPQVATETLGVASQGEQLSKAIGFNWQTISLSVVSACALVALIRHVRDKRMLS